MRIASWNIENLTRWLDDPVRFVAQVAAMGAPDILCLQEIRLRPRDVEEIARARMLLPDYACELSLR